MARVTVEDCVTKIPNRFELLMLASQRARDISAGAELTVDDDDDKHPVIALREIAEETVTPDALAESLLHGLQRHAEIDEPDEDEELALAEVQGKPRGGLDAAAVFGPSVADRGGAVESQTAAEPVVAVGDEA